MNLRRLALYDVFCHTATELDVPEAGVVAITGPNGSGKSSLIEAPGVAFYGKTLRGKPPWPEAQKRGAKNIVRVETDICTAMRARVGGRISFEWARGGTPLPSYENTTKSQSDFDAAFGGFDIWRRSRVFSSSDASHFTLAPDSERKRLLEAILGIERFDGAHERCKADLKTVGTARDRLERELDRTRLQFELAKKQEEECRRKLKLLPEFSASDAPAKLVRLAQLTDALRQEDARMQQEWREHENKIGGVSAEANSAKGRLFKLGNKSSCTTCGQSISEEMRSQLRSCIEQEEAELAARRAVVQGELTTLQDSVRELREEMKALENQRTALAREFEHQKFTQRQRGELSEELAKALFQTNKLALALGAQSCIEKDFRTMGSELEVVEEALGLRGARANILGNALAGVETVANAWLHRLPLANGNVIKLQLKSYTEKKSGGVMDAISIDVIGAGGSQGYMAASAGERRRIDVALVFGFSAVALEAQEADAALRLGGDVTGSVGGTLFFDEVFDALDGVGVEAVSDAIREMAKDRAVLVVTHNNQVLSALRPEVHWAVDGGKVTVSPRRSA